MSKQGEHLQNYNNQLVKCIEEMREKKETVTLTFQLTNNGIKVSSY